MPTRVIRSSLAFISCIVCLMGAARPASASKGEKSAKNKSGVSKWSYVLGLHWAHQMQSERGLQTTSETVYQIGEFSGASFFPSLGLNYQANQNYGFLFYLNRREIQMAGHTQTDNSVTTNKLELNQSFLGIGSNLQIKSSGWKNFGLLLGAEYAKGKTVSLDVIEGPPINEGEVEPPNFLILNFGFSYALQMGRGWELSPTLTAGAVVTSNPFILIFESAAALRRAF